MKMLKKYRELILYIVFGAATTAVNWAVYSLLMKLMPGAVSAVSAQMLISNAAAWVTAVLFAFIVNKYFVFESRDFSVKVILKEGFSFFAARGVTGLFEVFLPEILYKAGLDMPLFGIEGFWAKAVVSVLIIVLNYVFSKLIIFKKKQK